MNSKPSSEKIQFSLFLVSQQLFILKQASKHAEGKISYGAAVVLLASSDKLSKLVSSW